MLWNLLVFPANNPNQFHHPLFRYCQLMAPVSCISRTVFAVAYSIEELQIFMAQKSFPVRAITVLMIIVLFITGVFTIARNHVYRSEIAIWEDTREKSPSKARVYNNLGYAYFLDRRYEDARNAYLTALSLKPDYSLT